MTLKRAEGEQDTVLRVQIDELVSSGMSLMPEGLEKELDRRLPRVVPTHLLESVERELDEELQPFRSRMPPERLEEVRQRARLERLRRTLDLPRLAVVQPEQ